MSVNKVGNDILAILSGNLNFADIKNFALSCKRFRNVILNYSEIILRYLKNANKYQYILYILSVKNNDKIMYNHVVNCENDKINMFEYVLSKTKNNDFIEYVFNEKYDKKDFISFVQLITHFKISISLKTLINIKYFIYEHLKFLCYKNNRFLKDNILEILDVFKLINKKLEWNEFTNIFIITNFDEIIEQNKMCVIEIASNNFPIIFASSTGCFTIAKYLLKNTESDPSVSNNNAIRMACKYNHTNIIELLLDDSRVNTTINKNDILDMMCTKGNFEIVKLLLTKYNVNPKVNNNSSMIFAKVSKNEEIIKLLSCY